MYLHTGLSGFIYDSMPAIKSESTNGPVIRTLIDQLSTMAHVGGCCCHPLEDRIHVDVMKHFEIFVRNFRGAKIGHFSISPAVMHTIIRIAQLHVRSGLRKVARDDDLPIYAVSKNSISTSAIFPVDTVRLQDLSLADEM